MSNVTKFANLLKKHLRMKMVKDDRSFQYDLKTLQELCEMSMELFKQEPSLSEINPPVVIVGDIHGQFYDLLRMFSLFNIDGEHGALCNKFVFLGDYVDRGRHSLECMILLLLLKVNFPKKFMLLRGNHECAKVNRVYGLHHEIENRFPKNEAETLFNSMNEVFNWMPIAGLVGKRILCMHGGISKHMTSLDDIRNIKRPLEDPSVNLLAMDLMWSDPMEGAKGFQFNKNRGVASYFGEHAVMDACNRLDLDLVVRGHQMMLDGYGFFANRKMCTIFTAPKYQADANNKGAVMAISGTGKVTFKILRPEDTSEDTEQETPPSVIPATADPPKKKKGPNLRKFQSASCLKTQKGTPKKQ